MRHIWVAACLATMLIAGQTSANDQTKKAQAAREKAEALEQNSSAEASTAPPSSSEVITKSEVQAVDPAGKEPLDDAITCLARTIYWEARNEERAGMKAIANVVMNRLGHKGFPEKICDVVTQGQEEGACQFSWWCDGRPDDAEEAEQYAIAKEIARKALNQQLKDKTDGAMYFHSRKASPDWAAVYIKTAEIGEHVFYRPKDGVAK